MAKNQQGFKLDLFILSILSKQDCYGYQFTRIIKKQSNDVINTQVSSLYPILYRMIDEGLISSYEQIVVKRRRRVYYRIEEKGKAELQRLMDEYLRTNAAIQGVLDYVPTAEEKEVAGTFVEDSVIFNETPVMA